MLYKIGDFSKKINVSVRTLRYYDKDIKKYKNINFKNIITNFQDNESMPVGNYNILLELSLDKIKYFNFEEFVKSKNN